eukprot:Gregarina_sp_Poly_1__5665@NODE_298_length_9826_cov_182_594221_g257_i0_p1_GENE_NODE_298_length_9826_cov_182_594221_g257_i0NODE_298_length_9826_cov_182_594221_g257_i0_p1_ORF_typecomplete_len860_score160_75zfrbx1/PF12678_7/1_6e06zfRING_2/PF13639_6/4_9e06zfRING_2/PF13639_6/5_5e03zfANAPC11/PF12861_7/6_8e05zfANAPC11/PF12861_7/1_5e03PHD/PF00628_29/8_9e02PHD/PF00628_29/0_0001zfC3HC4_2/PF13923_6/0_00028ProkRING_4/PF14447_6/0_0029ProkRING_4/PF14447_6/1_1e04zfRING_5/PF14634_6/0_0065Zn_ribbon_17/PF17120_5/0
MDGDLDDSLFDDSLFDGDGDGDDFLDALENRDSSELKTADDGDAFNSQVLASLSQHPSPLLTSAAASPSEAECRGIECRDKLDPSDETSSKRRRLSLNRHVSVSPSLENPILPAMARLPISVATSNSTPQSSCASSIFSFNENRDSEIPSLLWEEPPMPDTEDEFFRSGLAANKTETETASNEKETLSCDETLSHEKSREERLPCQLFDQEEIYSETPSLDLFNEETETASPETWEPPPRSPDVACNRLSKVRLEEMFGTFVDLRRMASANLEADEEPVCCACLLDLFPEPSSVKEEEETAAHTEETAIQETAIKEEETLLSRRQAARAQRRKCRLSTDEISPTTDETIGLLSSCLHVFHAECIARWSRTENACCQCKQRYGALAYYNGEGGRSRIISIKKTLQATSNRLRIIEDEEEDASSAEVCQVCHRVGDKESLMRCQETRCDSIAHWYCFDLESRPAKWRCRDCAQPPQRQTSIPQPSRRRVAEDPNGRRRKRGDTTETRAQRTQARIHQALNQIPFPYLQAPVPPVQRLLPSETDTSHSKSKVDDLILGTVSLSELGGTATQKRRVPAPKRAPAKLLQPLAAKPALRPSVSPAQPPRAGSSPMSHSLANVFASIRSLAEKSERRVSTPPMTSSPAPVPASRDEDVFFDPTDLLLSTSLSTASIRPSSTTPRPKPPQRERQRPSVSVSKTTPKPPPSLLVPKSFIQSAQLAAGPKSESVPRLPLKSCPSRINRPASTTVGVSVVSKELQEVVASLVERQHPVVMNDLRSLFPGKAQLFLEARTRLMQTIAEAVVTPPLVAECHRRFTAERRAFWESKRKLLAGNICNAALVINAGVRRQFLQDLAASLVPQRRP